MKIHNVTPLFLIFLSISAFCESGADIIKMLQPAASRYGTNALHPTKSTPEQNAYIVAWDKEFAKAKAFIIDNSKNLIGVKDSDIINGANALEKANMDIANAIKVIRAISTPGDLKNQITKLREIKRNLVAATNKLSTVSMNLANKKEAKNVIISVGRFLEQIIDAFIAMVEAKIGTKIPTRPV